MGSHQPLIRRWSGGLYASGREPSRRTKRSQVSPDGKTLAFYSDLDGAAHLWIWDRLKRLSRRLRVQEGSKKRDLPISESLNRSGDTVTWRRKLRIEKAGCTEHPACCCQAMRLRHLCPALFAELRAGFQLVLAIRAFRCGL